MNFIAWMIIGCEIAFWIMIILGLVTRYILKRQRLGLFLLATTPIIDLTLLIMTSMDLYRGATATMAHSIAAIYIGVSLGFGKSMIEWADKQFKYYIMKDGSKPAKLYGTDLAKHYFKGWIRHIIAYGIGAGLLGLLILIIQDANRTEVLLNTLGVWTIVIVVDSIISMSYFIWPKKMKVNP